MKQLLVREQECGEETNSASILQNYAVNLWSSHQMFMCSLKHRGLYAFDFNWVPVMLGQLWNTGTWLSHQRRERYF